MAEILLCNQPVDTKGIESQWGIASSDILGGGDNANPASLIPYRPYLISQNPSVLDRSLVNQLGPRNIAQNLTDMSLSFGADNTLALAHITAKLKEYNIATTGAVTSLYGHRVQGFGVAVKKYQDALLAYRDVLQSKSAGRVLAKQRAFAAYKQMQTRFRFELQAVTAASKARRGTPLTSATRATNIARSSRNVARLHVVDQFQASNLVKLGKQAKFLGNGLAVIDFGVRVGNIENSYKTGGNWEREMFVESSSFALSAGAGSAIINAGGAVLSFLVVATPIGWVGLIIGGAVIAASAAGAGIWVNNTVKNNSGGIYDAIMKLIYAL